MRDGCGGILGRYRHHERVASYHTIPHHTTPSIPYLQYHTYSTIPPYLLYHTIPYHTTPYHTMAHHRTYHITPPYVPYRIPGSSLVDLRWKLDPGSSLVDLRWKLDPRAAARGIQGPRTFDRRSSDLRSEDLGSLERRIEDGASTLMCASLRTGARGGRLLELVLVRPRAAAMEA